MCLRSFGFLFIFLDFFFVFSALSGLNWHRNRAFSGQKLPFKKWKCCRKDQPRKSKDVVFSAYCRWKISKGVEPEFLTNFFNFMLRDRGHQLWIWMKFKTQKSTLVHGFTQRDYTLGKNNHFNYTLGEKKLGVNQTVNSDNIFKTGHLNNMSNPLTSNVTQKINTLLLLTWLSFVGIHVSLLLFALLTYSKVEEIRTLNLEACTRYKISAAGIFLKFDPLHI